MKKNEIICSKVKPDLIEKMPAPHGIRDCGRHYNIWEPDDGFPQEGFFKKSK